MKLQKFKTIITAAFMAVSLTVPVALPAMAGAAGSLQSEACKGLDQLGASGTGCASGKAADNNPVYGLIGDIVNILSWVVGIAAVITIIVAGLQYVTSGGDSAKVTSAKNTLIYALVGIVIAVAAQLLTHIAVFEGNKA